MTSIPATMRVFRAQYHAALWKDGVSEAVAMQKAARFCIQSRGPLAHPEVWAGASVYGDPGRIP